MASKKEGTGFSAYMKSDPINITIDTGEDKTTFRALSMELLKARSPFLARKIAEALKPTKSPEGSFFVDVVEDSEVRLPSIRLEPFNQFLQWIMNQSLNVAVASPPLLVDTYLLAHKFECVAMRNDLLNTLCEYHVANPGAAIGLPSMVKLADALPPDHNHNVSKNLLLKFMVHQLTYKIFNAGWEVYRLSKPFESLIRKSPKVVYWHLDALHEMHKAAYPRLDSGGAYGDGSVRIKADPDADHSVGGAAEFPTPTKKRKMSTFKKGGKGGIKGGSVPNPAMRGLEGCLYHEHPNGGGEAKCFRAVDLTLD